MPHHASPKLLVSSWNIFNFVTLSKKNWNMHLQKQVVWNHYLALPHQLINHQWHNQYTEPLPNPPCLKSSNSFSSKHIPHLTPDENDTPSPSVRVEEKSGETNRLTSRKISRRKWVEDIFVDIPKCFVDFFLYQQHHNLFRICSGAPFILHGDRKIIYFSPKKHFSHPQKLAYFFQSIWVEPAPGY